MSRYCESRMTCRAIVAFSIAQSPVLDKLFCVQFAPSCFYPLLQITVADSHV